MYPHPYFPTILTFSILLPMLTFAACCLSSSGYCNDGSIATPHCGHDECNILARVRGFRDSFPLYMVVLLMGGRRLVRTISSMDREDRWCGV